jgi:hypothetical protein
MIRVVTDDPHDLYWLNDSIEWMPFHSFIQTPCEADLVYFSGGEDVSPSLYGEQKLKYTFCNYYRDKLELKVYSKAKELKIPQLGVCRGSQFLTVVQPKGRLIQDVSCHGGDHFININNKFIITTSTHHQMMYPFDTEHELIAVANPSLSKYYNFGEFRGEEEIILEEKGEPEIVYYPDCLAIQGHPEYLDKDADFPKLCKELVYERLLQR